MHVRHRRVPARHRRDARAALGGGAGRLRGLAARRRDHLLPGRPGLHRRRRGELAAERRPDRRSAATSIGSAAPRPMRASVVFVPGLAGLAAPFWRPAARGVFAGLSLATSRQQLVRAVVEGIAAQVAWLARAAAADLGRPLAAPARRRRPHPLALSSCRCRPICCRRRSRSTRRRTPPRSASPRFARLGAGAASAPTARSDVAAGRRLRAADQRRRGGVAPARWRRVAEATMDLG